MPRVDSVRRTEWVWQVLERESGAGMNINDTIVPDSSQLNAEDMLGGPVTVTVSKVDRGSAEQPVNIHLAEFPDRAYRPCKSMRRVLVRAWGPDAAQYVGRKLTLFNDPSVKWGGVATGGIRISHLSHIPKRITLALTVTRGKRAPFVVDPLPDEIPPPLPDDIPSPPLITPEVVTEFERDIAAAKTVQELESIGADLKALDLGKWHEKLAAVWSERQWVLQGQAGEPVQEELT
jgi:hypothetical protein